jgi:hypothetical protein
MYFDKYRWTCRISMYFDLQDKIKMNEWTCLGLLLLLLLLLLFICHSINPKGGYRICHNEYKYKYNTRNKIWMITLNENINKRDIIIK